MQDRKKLGAIARRTNAFKLNEDIVLPLSALAEFSDFVDQYNIEEQRYNQKSVVWQLDTYIKNAEPAADPQWMTAKIPTAGVLRVMTKQARHCLQGFYLVRAVKINESA